MKGNSFLVKTQLVIRYSMKKAFVCKKQETADLEVKDGNQEHSDEGSAVDSDEDVDDDVVT